MACSSNGQVLTARQSGNQPDVSAGIRELAGVSVRADQKAAVLHMFGYINRCIGIVTAV